MTERLNLADAQVSASGVSNTPPQSRHASPLCGGEDWLTGGFQTAWSNWPKQSGHLAAVKASAGNRGRIHDKAISQAPLGNYEIDMSPAGLELGELGKGPYMAYKFACQGLTFLVEDCPAPRGKRCNVRFNAPGRVCLQRGGLGCLELARDIVRQAGGIIDLEVLSKVDMCVDLPGVGMDPFWDAAREERFVTRSHELSEIKHRSRTLRFGLRPLSLSIYDKLRQVRNKQDPDLLALMVDRRWGGVVPRQAVRVEFSLGRAKLKEYGVGSPADYFRLRGALVADLCTNWFRLTESKVDRRNTTRAATLPLWLEVGEAFAAWAGQPNGEVLVPLPRGPVNVDHLLKQSYGITKKIGCEVGRNVVGYDEHCDLVLGEALYEDA